MVQVNEWVVVVVVDIMSLFEGSLVHVRLKRSRGVGVTSELPYVYTSRAFFFFLSVSGC
jgi:hypothetical protein